MLGYLDPGGVTMALGAVAAGAAGVGVAIKSKFAGLRGKNKNAADDAAEPVSADATSTSEDDTED